LAITGSCFAVTGASSARAATSGAEVAQDLAQAVGRYQGSVTSPIVDIHHRLTDVALVEPSATAPVTIEILRYQASAWRVEQRISSPAALDASGHFTAASENPPAWLQVFDLGVTRPAFAIYLSAADHWNGLVVGKLTSRWEIVPFREAGDLESDPMVYKNNVLSYPLFHSPSDVTTEYDNCIPSCANGTFTWRLFRFASAKSRFVQVGSVRTGLPPGGQESPLPSSQLVTRSGSGYTIDLPGTWTFTNESYPSDHSTFLWADPNNEDNRVELVVSGCVGCAENMSTGQPDPQGLVPSGTSSITQLSPCKVAYAGSYTGGYTAHAVPPDPYPDNGLIVVLLDSGRVDGSWEVDLWLQPGEQTLATQILNSFEAGQSC